MRRSAAFRQPGKHGTKLLLFILCLIGLTGAAAWYLLRTPTQPIQDTETRQGQAVTEEPQPTFVRDNTLEGLLADFVTSSDASYGISVHEVFRTDLPLLLRTADYNAGAQLVPASTYKIYVAVIMLQAIEQGTYSLDTPTRTGESVNVCLEKMIVNSDNDCGRALGFLLGWQDINQALWDQGISTKTDLYNYVDGSDEPVGDKYTTTEDTTKLLTAIYDGSSLNKDHTTLLLSLMERQLWRERLAAGLPAGTKIASKPGWLDGIQAEIGIVYGPNSTYVISVLSTEANSRPLADLSALIYSYLNP